jgi:hypothetical protein
MVLVSIGVAAALSACESTQTKSARIAREGREAFQANRTLTVRRSADVRVERTAIVRGAGGAIAAAVELRNAGARARRDVPVVIDVRSRGGTSLYKNDVVGLQPALQRLASLRAHGTAWWVNDQVTAASAPRRVVAEIGTAPAAAAIPALAIEDPHFDSDATGRYLTATVTNPTNKIFKQVPVFAVALKGTRVVAAGRAFVAKLLPASARKPAAFRIYFVGDARGARVALTIAPPAS